MTDPPLLTRELVLEALRQLDETGPQMPLSTVYDLVYRGRRYAPRQVAQLAYRLATGEAAAKWPLRAGAPTNRALEELDFTIATKRPTLENSPLLDGDVAAQEQMQELYTGSPRAAKPEQVGKRGTEAPAQPGPAAAQVQEPTAGYAPPAKPYTLEMARAELFLSADELAAARAALQRRRNLLLQGPPGTGKTFLARRLAWLELGATDAARIELVQFHPSYSYEDFVQGFRPDGQGAFRLQNGILVDFCQRAAQDPDHPYFLLIDELNRGHVARIFGELLVLLEADKRGPAHALRLPYAPAGSPPFFVPENVFVIGTMNLADRSLAPLDYALRRRFAFVSLRPEFGEPLRGAAGGPRGAGQRHRPAHVPPARPQPDHCRRPRPGPRLLPRPQLLLPPAPRPRPRRRLAASDPGAGSRPPCSTTTGSTSPPKQTSKRRNCWPGCSAKVRFATSKASIL